MLCLNSSVNYIDPIGLYTLVVLSHFEVAPNKMPQPYAGEQGSTVTVLRILDAGRWESCPCSAKRRVGTDLLFTVDIYYRQDADFNEVSYGGHTLVEHENLHMQIGIDKYADPVQRDLDKFLGKCLPEACADALWEWWTGQWLYYDAVRDLANFDFHVTEFDLGRFPITQANRLAHWQELVNQTVGSLQRSFDVVEKCGASNPLTNLAP